MKPKLDKLILSITDEISMVGFKQFQQINEAMCTVKGGCDGNWGIICALAVGNSYQLPPVAQSPVYMTPHTVTTLSDLAPNGWKDMQLHELTQIMRQRDMEFAECLNNIHRATAEENSAKDILLQNCKLHATENDTQCPCDAMQVYVWNKSGDEWNEKRLHMLDGIAYESIALDSKRDDCTQLCNFAFNKAKQHHR